MSIAIEPRIMSKLVASFVRLSKTKVERRPISCLLVSVLIE